MVASCGSYNYVCVALVGYVYKLEECFKYCYVTLYDSLSFFGVFFSYLILFFIFVFLSLS